MTGVQSLAARSALAVTLAGASIWATSVRRFYDLSDKAFDRLALGVLWTSRVGLYLLLFVILRIEPRGDVTGYFREAVAALGGWVPQRDFPTSYAPLHPYLDAAFVRFWHSPAAIIPVAIIAECCMLPVWLRIGRRMFAEPRLRTAAILYVTSPISLQYVSVDGQDNILLALFFALALMALYQKRETLSGILVGQGVSLLKFLPVVYAPLFFVTARRRVRWVLGFVAVNLAVYGFFAHLHADLLFPFHYEGSLRSASNVWFVLESVLGIAGLPFGLESSLLDLILLVIVAYGAFWILRSRPELRPRVATFATLATLVALMLFSKKSWPAYLMLTLFPLCLLFGGGRRPRLRIALFAGFTVVALTTHSIWSTLLNSEASVEIHRGLLTSEPVHMVFLATQFVLLGGYTWLLVEALRATRESVTSPELFGSEVETARFSGEKALVSLT